MTLFCVGTTVSGAVSHRDRTANSHTLAYEKIIQHHGDPLGAFEAVAVKASGDLALH